MSWLEPEDGWPEEPEVWEEPGYGRWPLHWRGLFPREQWVWFEQLWGDVCMLGERYRLPIGSGWWEDQIQVEALAAFAAWLERYDSGEWGDPRGKLALLYELERLGGLLRVGSKSFHPGRDRRAFLAYLAELGCKPPSGEEREQG